MLRLIVYYMSDSWCAWWLITHIIYIAAGLEAAHIVLCLMRPQTQISCLCARACVRAYARVGRYSVYWNIMTLSACMHACVRVCACVCVCVCVCVYIYALAHTHTHMNLHQSRHTYTPCTHTPDTHTHHVQTHIHTMYAHTCASCS